MNNELPTLCKEGFFTNILSKKKLDSLPDIGSFQTVNTWFSKGSFIVRVKKNVKYYYFWKIEKRLREKREKELLNAFEPIKWYP